MTKKDIRWVQRLNNYQNALAQLEEAVELASERDLTNLEKEGAIQRFEYTQELAWRVITDFYKSLGNEYLQGSRDAFRLAFQRGLITRGEELLESIKSRNMTAHAYNKEIAEKILHDIIIKFYGAFKELEQALLKEKEERSL